MQYNNISNLELYVKQILFIATIYNISIILYECAQ